MKRSLESISDESNDEVWDLDLSGYRASDVSNDEEWYLDLSAYDTPQKTARVPRPVFDHDEASHKVTVTKHGKPRQVYASYAEADGTLRGGCHHLCLNHQFDDLMAFAPLAGAAQTAAKRTRFEAAYDAYKLTFARGDRDACAVHRATLEALRTKFCSACRKDPGYLSPAVRACKEWYDAKRQELCALNHGCANADCPERGPDVWPILTADHGANPKARHRKTGNAIDLSSYTQWPAHGGVPAMEAESKEIEAWICHVCHALAPTSASGNRCPDPATMPTGKRSGTNLEIAKYRVWRKAKLRHPKQQYVDAAKRTIGCCAACTRPVLPGTEAGFDFVHIDDSTKSKGGLFGMYGGVSGLVGNFTKAAALERVQRLLDAEMALCQLLCKNCHHRKTYGYPASTTVF